MLATIGCLLDDILRNKSILLFFYITITMLSFNLSIKSIFVYKEWKNNRHLAGNLPNCVFAVDVKQSNTLCNPTNSLTEV
jgi:hypothetical protein